MSRLDPFWFRPKYQADEANPAEFQLKPMSLPVLMDIRSDWKGKQPSGAGFSLALRSCLLDWRNVKDEGVDLPFSQAALDTMIQAPNSDFFIWASQIVIELLSRVQLSESERKNS